MNLSRYISTETIDLYLPPPEEPPDNPELNLAKYWQRQKENLLESFVDMLDRTGKVLRKKKLITDFVNRERQMSTALEGGLAIPHVRSRHIRDLVIGFARSEAGFNFDALDAAPTFLFFIIASPSQLCDIHIKIYKQIAMMFTFGDAFQILSEAQHPGEVIRFLRQFD